MLGYSFAKKHLIVYNIYKIEKNSGGVCITFLLKTSTKEHL